MNIPKLYQDFGIQIAPEGHKHTSRGWVHTPCPFCRGAHEGFHLGYCEDRRSQFYGKFICWRCGSHKTWETLAKLLNVTLEQARAISIQYGGTATARKSKQAPRPILPVRNVILPPNTKRLKDVIGAVRYLQKRKFDPDMLEAEWGVMATGPGCRVQVPGKDGRAVDYSFRIIVPITYQGKVVSYQGRDWTGKSERKYLACLPELESRPIKHTLYGLDKCEGTESVELVEGVTDAWRIGPGAVACYGIKHVAEQVRLLARFERVGLMFDPEAQAKVQARRIIRELEERGVETVWRKLPEGKDPADLNNDEIGEMLK